MIYAEKLMIAKQWMFGRQAWKQEGQTTRPEGRRMINNNLPKRVALTLIYLKMRYGEEIVWQI